MLERIARDVRRSLVAMGAGTLAGCTWAVAPTPVTPNQAVEERSVRAPIGLDEANQVFLSMPLGFEELPDGRFWTSTAAGSVTLENGAARFDVPGASEPRVVRMQLTGAESPSPAIPGPRLTWTRSHYFGTDPTKWRRGIPVHGRIGFESVRPGVDIFYRGRNDRLELDLLVAPGVDESEIGVVFDGIDSMSLEPDGSLRLAVGDMAMIHHPPVSWQREGSTVREIPTRFALRGPNEIGFALDGRDPERPVMIDPVITYSGYVYDGTQYGSQSVRATATDGNGHVYLTGTGYIESTPGAWYGDDGGGTFSFFVLKAPLDGSGPVYVVKIGNPGMDLRAIAADVHGHAYVTGWAEGDSYPTTGGTVKESQPGRLEFLQDGFLTKILPDGSDLAYSTLIGGTRYDEMFDVAVVPDGRRVWVVGTTTSDDFPSVNPIPDGGADDCVLVALNENATAYQFASPTPACGRIAIAGDAVFLADGDTDLRVARVEPWDRRVAWVRNMGGSADDTVADLAASPRGHVLVTGKTASTDFPVTPGAEQSVHGGGATDAFAVLLGVDGAVRYATYLGGTGDDEGMGGALDSSCNSYLAGRTASADFPVTPIPGGGSTLSGPSDAFVSKLDVHGRIDYSFFYGGAQSEWASDIQTVGDPNCSAVVGGSTTSDDFPRSNSNSTFGDHTAMAFAVELTCAPEEWVADLDCDGVPDSVDNCPDVENPDQADSDGDGRGDACDGCETPPGVAWGDRDGDGIEDYCDVCPDDPTNLDSDGDGVCDRNDNCPDHHNPDQTDSDGDGFGDACDFCKDTPSESNEDRDNDGIGDACDNCPCLHTSGPEPDDDGDGVGNACDSSPLPIGLCFQPQDPANPSGPTELLVAPKDLRCPSYPIPEASVLGSEYCF